MARLIFFVVVLFAVIWFPPSVARAGVTGPPTETTLPVSVRAAGAQRPGHGHHVDMARWLVAQSIWGVLSTISTHLDGAPFGNVASFSDGPPGNSSGVPLFFLTSLDPTIQDTQADARCSLTVAEAALGTCGQLDPESPACAKLTLSGQMMLVTDAEEKTRAEEALFSKHAEMRYWPKGHHFQFYKLDIRDIFLIDWFGGAKPISVEDYYAAASPTFTVADLK